MSIVQRFSTAPIVYRSVVGEQVEFVAEPAAETEQQPEAEEAKPDEQQAEAEDPHQVRLRNVAKLIDYLANQEPVTEPPPY